MQLFCARRPERRRDRCCAFHAVGFELVLLALLIPVIAWDLGLGLLHALAVDVACASAYMVYGFVFHLDLPSRLPAANVAGAVAAQPCSATDQLLG
jgi:uncharacterized membrane protein